MAIQRLGDATSNRARARRRRGWLAGALVLSLTVAPLGAGNAGAEAAPICGAATAASIGETAESTWAGLQTDVGAVAPGDSASFYLTSDLTATAGENLAIQDGAAVTIDLDGCELAIISPSTSEAAIEVPLDSSLEIDDSSAASVADQGTLTATGGAGDSADGSGAGIGGDGSQSASDPGETAGTITINAGTVIASGGGDGSPEGAFGAGIGGGGGYPNSGGDGTNGGAGGIVDIEGGSVTATGYADSPYSAGGAGIGGGGGGAASSGAGGTTTAGAGGAGGQVRVDGGSVVASAAVDGSVEQTGGAGIGGGGGGYGESSGNLATVRGGAGGTGSIVTVTAGTVSASATATAGEGGAGIGGGGGAIAYAAYPAYTADGGRGGNGAAVTINGGSVTASGSSGGSGGAGAGIGGGAGGNTTGENENEGLGGSGSAVTISGGVVSAFGSSARSSSASDGLGFAGGGDGGYRGDALAYTGSGGSVTVPDNAGGLPSLAGEIAGPWTVGIGSTVAVADGSTLSVDASAINDGVIDLAGAMVGSGSVDNEGSITVSGSDWSLHGFGTDVGSGPGVTGNVFQVTFTADHQAAPVDMYVFAPSFADSGEVLPDGLDGDGYEFDSWAVVTPSTTTPLTSTSTTALSTLATSGTVALTATYLPQEPTITASLSSWSTENKAGWWHTPVTVKFVCYVPDGGTIDGGCPAAVTLSKNARGQSVTETITASDELQATAAESAINIDRGLPSVKIAGPKNGRIYEHHAPQARCVATEKLSGIASCKLSTKKTRIKRGYRESITAKAQTRAGVSKSVRVTFKVD